MSILAGGVSYPTVKFKTVGDSVAGRIVAVADVQATEFGSSNPAFWPDGSPKMQAKLTLETEPGNEESRVNLYITPSKNMRNPVRAAIAAAGRSDVQVGDDIALTFTGYEGVAKVFQASYAAAEG